jgi:hypothetical protein
LRLSGGKVRKRKVPKKVLDLPLEERALLALRAAVKKAYAEHARQGLPVYVWSGGRVVKLPASKLRAYLRPTPKRKTRNEKISGSSR